MRYLIALLFSVSVFAQPQASPGYCPATPVTGTGWTTSTAVNTTQTLVSNVQGQTVSVALDQGTTLTVGAIQFQGDPGDGNVVNLPAWNVTDPTSASNVVISMPYTLQASTNKQFLIHMGGNYKLVLKLTTAITGTATVTPYTTINCFDPFTPINNAALGGVAISTGTGASGTGTQRVVTSTDSSESGTLSDNGAAASTNRLGVLPAIAETNMPSAATAGRDVALRTDLRGNLYTAMVPSGIPTFGASKLGLVPASSPTDIAVLSGNATNTVVPVYVSVSCTQTTAGIIDIQLMIRTTADSGGTSTGSPSSFPYDQNNSAAVSSVLTYTANPTVNDGTNRPIDNQKIGALATSTATPSDLYVWRPSMGQSIVLRGTAQQLAVNLNAATLTGGSCDIVYRWIETTGL